MNEPKPPPPEPVAPTPPPGYEQAVQDILRPTQKLSDENAATRRLVSWAIAGVMVAFIAIAIGGVAIWRSANDRNAIADAASRALAAQAAQDYKARVAQCESGNVFRQADYQSWLYIINLPPTPGQTSAQAKARVADVKAFKQFKAKQDAPTDCTKIPVPVIALPLLHITVPPTALSPSTTATTIPPPTTISLGNTSRRQAAAQAAREAQIVIDQQGGSPGPQGPPGARGAPGPSPFPFRFTFTFHILTVGGQAFDTVTVHCVVTSASAVATCS